MRPHRGKANTDQLRDDIDRGRTGEKVRFPDPAAAPLGTDDEAAGSRPDPGTVAAVRRDERARADRMRARGSNLQAWIWVILAAAAIGLIAILLLAVVR